MNNKNAAKSGADKKGKEIPVYTQQDDSELLEATGKICPMPIRPRHQIRQAVKEKPTVICRMFAKNAADKISQKNDEPDGEAEEPDERDEN